MVKILKCPECGYSDIIKRKAIIQKYNVSIDNTENLHYILQEEYIDETKYICTHCYNTSKYINRFIVE